MCHFGSIKDIPDSCDEKVCIYIVGSSCAICPLSKSVLNLSKACYHVEPQSLTDKPTTHPTIAGEDGARAGPEELSN